jgi:two-component system sensor histidine kinase PilS (NtrC family)
VPMSRWQALSHESRATFWRSLQTLNVTRVVVALVLLAYLGLTRNGTGDGNGMIYAETCAGYLAAALVFTVATVYLKRQFLAQLCCQVAVDLVAISLLYLAAGGARSGLGILYLFPLAGAAILAPLVLALFSASVATLLLIGESAWAVFTQDNESTLRQAGMYGAGFFAVVLLVSRLAARLIKQEELAAQRGADLKIQQAINQLVIADVGDGILVVGRDGRVFAGNPAARRMLGLDSGAADFRLGDVAALAPLAQAFQAWHDAPDGQGGPVYVNVKPWNEEGEPSGLGRLGRVSHLKLRFARVDTPDQAAGRCVVFLQDVSAIENQAQQLKLASMGRLTASIAHEVRNPLSAIGHATSLLAEDLAGPTEVRLLKIIGDNVARVNRMVEDILQLSRKVQPSGEPVRLAQFLAELKAEFSETHDLPDDMMFIGPAADAQVRFDPMHLREVLLNLLGNAIRYASKKPASIRLFTVLDPVGRRELHVQDDGPGITPEVRDHLFEPFYTTSRKGTGLGLYLARELCLNNEAMLDYEYRFENTAGAPRRATGRFVITFAQPAINPAPAANGEAVQ